MDQNQNSNGPTLGITGLVKLLNAGKNKEVKKIAKNLIITQEDLVNLILFIDQGLLSNFYYAVYHHEFRPDELELSHEEISSFAKRQGSYLNQESQKTLRKISQLFKNRRLLSVHLFYSSQKTKWHMFYFDQRDYEDSENNHWKEGGSHIHYSLHSFINIELDKVWSDVKLKPAKLPKSIHIKYINQKLT